MFVAQQSKANELHFKEVLWYHFIATNILLFVLYVLC